MSNKEARSCAMAEIVARWVTSEKFYPAIIFAVGVYSWQARKNSTGDLYLAHLLTVAELVAEDN
jgi:hypothetical protein